MATYSGSSGIAKLRAKLKLKAKLLVSESVEKIAISLIDNSPVGVEYYPSKQGVVFNDAGDYKNSWMVGLGAPDQSIRVADPSGAGAVAGAISTSSQYNFQKQVFITNSVDHAGQVEEGWKENPEYGWKAKSGYRVVANHISTAKVILEAVALKVSQL